MTDSAWPALAAEVHVWSAELDCPERLESLYTILSGDERERAERFRFPLRRGRFIAARALLRQILGRYLEADPSGLRFDYEAKGKPNLAGGELQFNVSHSHGLAIFAIARNRTLGADVERIRPMPDALRIADHFFAPVEIAALRSLPPDRRDEAFFACWTRKEAYIKARGEGLSMPLDQFEVSLLPDEPARLVANHRDPGETERWFMRSFTPTEGFAAAVVAEGGEWELAPRALSPFVLP